MDLTYNPFEYLAKAAEETGAGGHNKLAAAQIRAQGFQAIIAEHVKITLECLNQELARLDKSVNEVTASHADKLMGELDELNSKALPEVASEIRESTAQIKLLTEAISDFNSQNAAVLTSKLTTLVDTIQTESKGAGDLTKWLIGTAIVACLVNVGVCWFTALMAFKTADLAELTKQSVELDRGQIK